MSPTPSAWTPIVTDAMASEIEDVVLAIGDALRDAPDGGDPSLASGSAGIALALAQLAGEHSGRGYAAAARARLAAAVAGAEGGGRFLRGVPGIAFAVLQLHPYVVVDDGLALVRAIEGEMIDRLRRRPWHGRWDLGAGLVGWGVFAAVPRPWSVEPLMAAILDALADVAHPDADARSWWVAPHLLAPPVRAAFPQGHADLGLAHGVAGVLAWLGRLPARHRDRAAAIVASAHACLRAHAGDHMPSFAPPHDGARRDAWCYGDPGLAVALASIGRIDDACAIAERSAARSVTVADAGLCHGAAGLAHVFHRLARVTGSPALFLAARTWLGHALARRRPGHGIAGFQRWEDGWVDDAGLLAGAAGVALALQAAVGSGRPTWDRALLLALEEADRDEP